MATISQLLNELERAGKLVFKPVKTVVLICFIVFLLIVGPLIYFSTLSLIKYSFFDYPVKFVPYLYIFGVLFMSLIALGMILSLIGPRGTIEINKSGLTTTEYFNSKTRKWSQIDHFFTQQISFDQQILVRSVDGSVTRLTAYFYKEISISELVELLNECKKKYA